MAKREQSQLPINYAEELAKEAAEIAKRIATPTGDRIRFNGSRGFTTPDGDEAEALEIVILDFNSVNLYYDGPYDKDNVAAPACFAIGPEPTTIIADDTSPDKQADSCSVCPMNQFGSALVGKGKACKNTRLIAVTPAADISEESPIWIASIPPASLKTFDAYVSGLASKHQTIPLGVVSEMFMDTSSDYAAPRFKVVRPCAADELQVLMGLRKEAQPRLAAKPDVSNYQPPKKTGRR
jgi:hypothetical protein